MPEIIFEDEYIVVCVKPSGVSSQEDGTAKSMPALLTGNCGGYIGVVHRLDKDVSGIMVYAKTVEAAGSLSKQITSGAMKKEYLAVLAGTPDETSGVYQDLLFHDSRKNKSYVVKRVRKGVREASLEYKTLAIGKSDGKPITMVRVLLHTGRTHQIRVQFASRNTPLMGDRKYGGGNMCKIALLSYRLSFFHPKTMVPLTFSADIPQVFPWNQFGHIEDCR